LSNNCWIRFIVWEPPVIELWELPECSKSRSELWRNNVPRKEKEVSSGLVRSFRSGLTRFVP
jgi:hypothetical protein